jgi:hypothetical protein
MGMHFFFRVFVLSWFKIDHESTKVRKHERRESENDTFDDQGGVCGIAFVAVGLHMLAPIARQLIVGKPPCFGPMRGCERDAERAEFEAVLKPTLDRDAPIAGGPRRQ